jgi:hypothetical protein
MIWLKYLTGLLTGLGFGAVLVLLVAAGQIKSSTDSRGVIHITNNFKAQEVLQADPAPAAAPSAATPRDKDEKLRILNERRGRLPSELWQEPMPEPLAAGKSSTDSTVPYQPIER